VWALAYEVLEFSSYVSAGRQGVIHQAGNLGCRRRLEEAKRRETKNVGESTSLQTKVLLREPTVLKAVQSTPNCDLH